ncbi:MAG: PadR family transcriptional regulator [Dehalobacterium sp.]
MKQSKCACQGAFLDKFIRPSILLELYDQDLTGLQLLKRLNQGKMSRYGKVDPTGFYRMLKNMEEAGYISSHWEIIKNEKPVKKYSITDNGKVCLKTWEHTFQQYIKDIGGLLAQIIEKTK